MAFRFTWPEFDNEFYTEAKSQLEAALNKGNKPSVIVDYITVKELNMGTKPPELEILEIGELGNDKFRGIFKLTYAGDAYIEIQTKVQANPMHAKVSDLPRHSRPSVLAADQPLVVPMVLRISDLKLRGIVVLVVSKTKGVTLVFKNDPLESIRVSSTFDCVSILRDFLQRQIEGQLRNMLQEDLPVMIHNLSTRYIQSEEEKKKKKEQLERQQKMIQPLTPCGSCISSPTVLQHLRSNVSISSLPELDKSLYYLDRSSMSSSNSSIYTPVQHFIDDIDYDHLSTSPSSYMSDYLTDIDLKKNKQLIDPTHLLSVPMTAANLFTHNRQYQLGIYPSVYQSNYFRQYQILQQKPKPLDLQSETEFSVISDIYANDADAPWYATEGPELNSIFFYNQQSNHLIQESSILSPLENSMVIRLTTLTNINYTLSPLTETISSFTSRSLPQMKKPNSLSSNRNKKIPKRRVTRLKFSAPQL